MDKMRSALILGAVILALLSACQDNGITTFVPNLGRFNYTSFDTSGNTKDQGILVLQTDNTNVSGTWQFQSGQSGELEGFIADNTMTLNLNPGYVDHNLVLHGTLTRTSYIGEWQQIGWAIMDHGTFSAFKQ